jgi:acetyl-CoA carboxylase biotin carboxylase subunit
MNTRIQVEHPVTEFVIGIDLLREMLIIADGAPLRLRQDDITIRGHAIEVRINAEDPANGFMPHPGKVAALHAPGGPGVRFDTLLYAGYTVPPFYDSLLGKLIVWGEDRPHAIARLKRSLQELEVSGVKTTKPLHLALADSGEVRAGTFHTRWLEGWLETNASRLSEEARRAPRVSPEASPRTGSGPIGTGKEEARRAAGPTGTGKTEGEGR